jgi:hypothetical protein
MPIKKARLAVATNRAFYWLRLSRAKASAQDFFNQFCFAGIGIRKSFRFCKRQPEAAIETAIRSGNQKRKKGRVLKKPELFKSSKSTQIDDYTAGISFGPQALRAHTRS